MAQFTELRAGGSGGGLVVKQITFTDRPSLASWMQDNWGKCIQATINSSLGNFSANSFSVANMAKVSAYYVFNGNTKSIRFDSVSVYFAQNPTVIAKDEFISLNNDNTISGTYDPEIQLPDEYWTAQGVSVTITYIE